ncbi:MAG: hypothetical protein FWF85_02440 [Clostridiales bacterium]|nr:hypothetical protein [Clostridiales bacterium]
MGTLSATLKINDAMTAPIKNIITAMNIMNNAFEAAQTHSKAIFDRSSLQDAREQLAQASVAMDKLNGNAEAVKNTLNQAGSSQNELNQKIRDGASAAGSLDSKLMGIVKTVASIAAIKKGINWIGDLISANDETTRINYQLKTVLANMGSGRAAYEMLAKEAEKYRMFSRDTMMAGAMELATYFQDPEATRKLMATLTNYAVGMEGTDIDPRKMTDLATGIGKATVGAYDALKKKGFEVTEMQKEILNTGTDMQKALVIDEIVTDSWGQLYDVMSETHRGAVLALKNDIADMKTKVADQLYPKVLEGVEKIRNALPQIEKLIYSIGNVAESVLNAGIWGMEKLNTTVEWGQDNWSKLGPIIKGVGVAIGLYIVSTKGAAIATGLLTASLNPVAWVAVATGILFAADGIAKTSKASEELYIRVQANNQVMQESQTVITNWSGAHNTAMNNAAAGMLNYSEVARGALASVEDALASLYKKLQGVSDFFADALDFFATGLLGLDVRTTIDEKINKQANQIRANNALSGLIPGRNEMLGNISAQVASALEVKNKKPDPFDWDRFNSDEISSGISSLGNIDKNTSKIVQTLEEDLRYLVDISERKAIDRVANTRIQIDIGGISNTFNDSSDLSMVGDFITEQLRMSVEAGAGGV